MIPHADVLADRRLRTRRMSEGASREGPQRTVEPLNWLFTTNLHAAAVFVWCYQLREEQHLDVLMPMVIVSAGGHFSLTRYARFPIT